MQERPVHHVNFKCFLRGLYKEKTVFRDLAKWPPRIIPLFSRFLNLFKLNRRFKEALRVDIVDNMHECCEVLIRNPFLCLLSLIVDICIRCKGIPGINQQ
jgi:hypothetical protein